MVKIYTNKEDLFKCLDKLVQAKVIGTDETKEVEYNIEQLDKQ